MQLRDEDFDNVDPGECRPLLQEGVWPAECLGRESKSYGGLKDKLTFQWRVFLSLDKSRSCILPRYYNAPRNKAGRFQFGQLCAYRNDWVAANSGRLPLDPKSLPPSIWEKGTFLVEVVTVRRTRNGPLAPSLYWSRIGRVIRPVEEGECWERLPVQLPNTSE